jgi:eukaryotic-like serine/threonine-protein kinase
MSGHSFAGSGDTSDRYDRVCQLFEESLDIDADARLAWLEAQASGDALLLSELKAMLQVDEGYVEPTTRVTAHWPEGGVGKAGRTPTSDRRMPCIPNYEILGEIAHGGMGIVYKARQLQPHRLVALKMMRRGHLASEEERGRFRTEANAAADLDNGTVVPIYEAQECDGEPYIVMKLIEGMNFEQRLRHSPMTADEVVTTLLPVCHAIAAAHEKGIIHRDLKPSNILIDGATQQPWVTDFGLAKYLHEDQCLTAPGVAMGTVEYMAPEQTLGQSDAISPATDVYGLGAVLYRALTGVPPIELNGDNQVDVVQKIRNKDVVPPRSRNRQIPNALNSICIKCLETDPRDRYQNAAELAVDLEHYLDGDAVSARPLSLHRRLLTWARTHPGLAASWCAIAAFFVYHLVCRHLGIRTDPVFETATSVITVIALFCAWFWQQLLSRTAGNAWVLYAWTASDVILLTTLSTFAQPGNSQLTMLYPVIVAASAIRCRPHLVGFATLISILGYAIRVGVSLMRGNYSNTQVVVQISDSVPMFLCIGVIGLIQYLILRRSAASLEAKSAMLSNSQFVGRTGSSASQE